MFEENHQTLIYAAQAGQIANRPVKNDDPQTRKINELKSHVRMLKIELLRAN
jgi:hypothetical protein